MQNILSFSDLTYLPTVTKLLAKNSVGNTFCVNEASEYVHDVTFTKRGFILYYDIINFK